MNQIELTQIGWDDCFESQLAPLGKGYLPARVVSRSTARYGLLWKAGPTQGILSGRFLHGAEMSGEYPVVGDWVAAEAKDGNAVIHALLPRRSWFSRKPAISGGRKIRDGAIVGGATTQQVLAANIDTVFIVCSLGGNLGAAGVERYLTAASAGNVSAVIVLNKLDLCDEAQRETSRLGASAGGRPVHMVSAVTGEGMNALVSYLRPGQTVAFLGPSGAGKSTLINSLFGFDLRKVSGVNEATGKGRHTTTRAELLVHESGCMLIDSPGIRELQLWCEESDVEDSFGDVAEIVRRCRFSDCSHGNEPGCAVNEALNEGSLCRERYLCYLKLHSEASRLGRLKKQREIYLGRLNKYSRH